MKKYIHGAAKLIIAVVVSLFLLFVVGNLLILIYSNVSAETGILAITAAIALYSIWYTKRRNDSLDYLNKAIDLLRRAYALFTRVLDGEGRPKSDRYLWMTVARMLKQAIDLRKHLQPAHLKIFNTELVSTKYQFAEILEIDNEKGWPESYWADDIEDYLPHIKKDGEREPISPTSIAYLLRFCKWDEGSKDPISDVPNFTEEEIKWLKWTGPRNLGNLMDSLFKRLEQKQ